MTVTTHYTHTHIHTYIHSHSLTILTSLTQNKEGVVTVHADDVIPFLQLSGQRDEVGENKYDVGLLTATGAMGAQRKEQRPSTQLSKVIQLTGFSDPVYAEAYVNVNQYDIVLDVLIVNQTPDTLQGLTLELATLGKHLLLSLPLSSFPLPPSLLPPLLSLPHPPLPPFPPSLLPTLSPSPSVSLRSAS